MRCFNRRCRSIRWHYRHLFEEVLMATQRHGQTVETPTEARQAEPGPSVLALLTVSTGLAILILGIVWFVFFSPWAADRATRSGLPAPCGKRPAFSEVVDASPAGPPWGSQLAMLG